MEYPGGLISPEMDLGDPQSGERGDSSVSSKEGCPLKLHPSLLFYATGDLLSMSFSVFLALQKAKRDHINLTLIDD